MDQATFQVLAKEWISLAILLPMVWFFLNRMLKSIDEWFGWINKALNENDKKHKDSYLEINKSIVSIWKLMGNTVLNTEQSVNLLLSNMWMVSWGKLDYIKTILKINHIEGRREEIRKKIGGELVSRSWQYIATFKEYITPIWDLSVWLDKNFTEKDFKDFLDEIMDICYTAKYKHTGKEAEIELKVNEIATVMKDLQNSLATKLRTDIKSYE